MSQKAKTLNSFSQGLTGRFTVPLDWLTAHLMYENAEVLAGLNPASLTSLVNRNRPCGRNLYKLWNEMGGVATARIPGIEFMVLQNKERAALLFCFNRQRLEGAISHPGVRILLTKAGYDANSDLDCHLSELRGRVEKGGSFPHEIGLFIGYPAKDVAAFMGLVKLPFRCQALWKIYGRPEKSLNLAESYRRCKNRMGGILNNLNSLDSDGSSRISDFFAHVNDTGCHILMEVQK